MESGEHAEIARLRDEIHALRARKITGWMVTRACDAWWKSHDKSERGAMRAAIRAALGKAVPGRDG